MSGPPNPQIVVVNTQDKPVIYPPNGDKVTIQRPVGFTGHPAVPPLRKKP